MVGSQTASGPQAHGCDGSIQPAYGLLGTRQLSCKARKQNGLELRLYIAASQWPHAQETWRRDD